MFRGRHDHTIDAKGRLSIPRVFRGELVGAGESPPMLINETIGENLFTQLSIGAANTVTGAIVGSVSN